MPTALDPFSGDETFAAPPSRAFAVLTDLDALAAAMPGLVSSERVDERTLKAVVRPGLSFMTGQVRLTLVLVEARPDEHATMHVAAASIGVGLSIDAELSLSPLDDGRRTRLAWEARVHDMKGLIAAVPAGLVRAAADKVITDGWQSLRPRIEG
jgi:carbon monoxide dehydrogenase subunit G